MTAARKTCSALLILACAFPGCVERTLSVQTEPSGALVRLNDSELGRTPVQRDFTWYGTYDVVIRKDGYETLKTKAEVIAPWYEWVPFDLISAVVPFNIKDERVLKYKLTE